MLKQFNFLIWLGVLIGLSSSQPQRLVEIRILSFSINHGKDFWAESNLRQVLKIINENKPDLVALQEVDSIFTNNKVSFHLRQLAVQTGYDYLYGASGKLENGTYGVGLLSRWVFEKTQKLELPTSTGKGSRQIVCGLVSPIEGFHLRVCNARLEYTSQFDRALQAAFVNQLLSPSIQPVLLALDMGARPGEQPPSSFQPGWLDAALSSEASTLSLGNHGDRVDYLYSLKNTKVRIKSYKVIDENPSASDHLPVMALFEF